MAEVTVMVTQDVDVCCSSCGCSLEAHFDDSGLHVGPCPECLSARYYEGESGGYERGRQDEAAAHDSEESN